MAKNKIDKLLDKILDSTIGKLIAGSVLLYGMLKILGFMESDFANSLFKIVLMFLLANALVEWLIDKLKDFWIAFKNIYDISKVKKDISSLKKKVNKLEIQIRSMNKKGVMVQLGYIVFIAIVAVLLYVFFMKLAQ